MVYQGAPGKGVWPYNVLDRASQRVPGSLPNGLSAASAEPTSLRSPPIPTSRIMVMRAKVMSRSQGQRLLSTEELTQDPQGHVFKLGAISILPLQMRMLGPAETSAAQSQHVTGDLGTFQPGGRTLFTLWQLPPCSLPPGPLVWPRTAYTCCCP